MQNYNHLRREKEDPPTVEEYTGGRRATQGLFVKSKRWSLTMENIVEKGKSKSIHGINMRIELHSIHFRQRIPLLRKALSLLPPPSPSTSNNSSPPLFSLHHQTIIARPPLSPSTAAPHSKCQNASTSAFNSRLTETAVKRRFKNSGKIRCFDAGEVQDELLFVSYAYIGSANGFSCSHAGVGSEIE
ncbi:hypothetical protein P8452_70544 [Trifolium repens]|nr:hypothetical protein P8452_70544 [Trifolium repens]